MLTRKFLQKKKDDENEEELKIKAVKKKEIDELDPLDFHKKRLDFRVEYDVIKSPIERLRDDIAATREQVRGINNFQKLVNAFIEDRAQKVDSIRNSKSQFDKDVANLSVEEIKNSPEIKSPLFRLDISEVKEILEVLENEQNNIKKKIQDQRSKLNESKKLYSENRRNVKRLHEHIKERENSDSLDQEELQPSIELEETLEEQ